MSRTSTRSRMVDSAIALLREQGPAGVTIDAVLARSGAPRGSVYHHFPGGRDEILVTAGRTSADYISHLIGQAVEDADPAASIGRFVDFWKAALEATDYRAGCPVVALAVGGRSDLADAGALARDTFDHWIELLASAHVARGADRDEAVSLATTTVAAVEGAIVLCRTQRSSEPLEQISRHLVRLLS